MELNKIKAAVGFLPKDYDDDDPLIFAIVGLVISLLVVMLGYLEAYRRYRKKKKKRKSTSHQECQTKEDGEDFESALSE